MPAPNDVTKPVVEVAEEPEKPLETQEVDTAPVQKPTLSAEDQLAAKIRDDFEKLYGGRMKELQNGFQSIQRINTKLQQELESLKKPVGVSVAPPVAGPDPWASIVDGPVWKAEIERVAEQKAKALLEQQEVLRSQQDELIRQEDIRTRLKQEVVVRYPDLGPDGDPNSQVSALFNEVLNEHKEYLSSPFGPRLAMMDMKEKLQQLGVVDPDTKLSQSPAANQEVLRRARASASSAGPTRTTIPPSSKVILTKDEMEFVKYQGLDPVAYAKNKQLLESTGTLEVP